MTTDDLNLSHYPGRCIHGAHLKLQGCLPCGHALKFTAQDSTTAAHPDDRAKVDAAIRQLAATGEPFSANDARPLHNVTGGVVGKAFHEAKRAGVIKPCKDDPLVRSSAGSTNGHHVFRWIGVAA